MRTYRTLTSITHASGPIGLSAAQASAREHLLIPYQLLDEQGNAVYLPNAPLQFKAGEVIGLEVVDKALAEHLELLEPPGILNRDVPGRKTRAKK